VLWDYDQLLLFHPVPSFCERTSGQKCSVETGYLVLLLDGEKSLLCNLSENTYSVAHMLFLKLEQRRRKNR